MTGTSEPAPATQLEPISQHGSNPKRSPIACGSQYGPSRPNPWLKLKLAIL